MEMGRRTNLRNALDIVLWFSRELKSGVYGWREREKEREKKRENKKIYIRD
jgi:hypothetical protein